MITVIIILYSRPGTSGEKHVTALSKADHCKFLL